MTTPSTTIYQAETLIGAGELGQVFRARRQSDGRVLALKAFHARVAAKADFRERLQRATGALVGLRGDGIVPVYELVAEAPRFYAAMDWLPEGSLRGLLQRRARASEAWPLAGVLDLARQVADALAVAHREGVPHRNLKPSNVLLTLAPLPISGPSQHLAMLSDFGVFRLAEEVIDAPGSLSFDTLAYASPEWFQGAEPDERSDIYSLGVLIYEIITGYPPFEGRSFNDAWKIRDTYALPSSAQQRPDLPDALHELILACLQKDAGQRPESAGEVSTALATIIRELPDEPTPSPGTLDEERVLVIPRVYKLGSQQQPTAVYNLSGDGLTVGSDPTDTIILDSAQIAAQQLQIDWLGDKVQVTLLAERDDALLEDRPLVPHQPETWVAGTMLRLGPYYLRLDLPGAPPPADSLPAGEESTAPPELPGAPAPATPDETAVADAAAEGYSCAIVLPEPAELLITPGTVALYKLTLINIGKQTDHFELEVEGAPTTAQISVLPRKRPQLNQNADQQVALSIDVPKRAASAAGEYTVTIIARSTRRNNAIAGQVPVLWHVQPFYADDLALRREVGQGRGIFRTSYPLTVINDGNAKLRYALRAADNDEALSYRWRDGQDQLRVNPGGRQASAVALRPHRLRLYGRPIRHAFSVQIMRDDQHHVRRDAVYEQLALIPWWLPLLALLVLAVSSWYLLMPRIEIVSIAQGTVVTVGAGTPVMVAAGTPVLLGDGTPVIVGAGTPIRFRAHLHNAQQVQVLYGRTPRPIRITRPLVRPGFTGYFSDTFEFTHVFTTSEQLSYSLLAPGMLPYQQTELPLPVTVLPPPMATDSPVPTATQQPPQTLVVTTILNVTQVQPSPQPSPIPSPTATPYVRNCERGGSYTLSGPARPNEVVLLYYKDREVDGQIVGADSRYRLRFSVPLNEAGGTITVTARTDGDEPRGEMQCFVALPSATPQPTAIQAQPSLPLLPTSPPPPPPSLPTPLVRPAATP